MHGQQSEKIRWIRIWKSAALKDLRAFGPCGSEEAANYGIVVIIKYMPLLRETLNSNKMDNGLEHSHRNRNMHMTRGIVSYNRGNERAGKKQRQALRSRCVLTYSRAHKSTRVVIGLFLKEDYFTWWS